MTTMSNWYIGLIRVMFATSTWKTTGPTNSTGPETCGG